MDIVKPVLPARSRGRPFGAKNYSGISLIARTMKGRGMHWIDELIDSYRLYKDQLACYNDYMRTLPLGAKLEMAPPDPALLTFWADILPYIALKMIERETRGQRPKKVNRRKITDAAINELAKAEGRTI